jgi:acyl-coenzyme A synthetase/AMP-(fatty) acid ligase
MGVTTVLPDMDFSRPAAADPQKILTAANDWRVTQAFASPAVWRNVSAYCRVTGSRIETLREIFSCGAPVSADVLRSTLALAAPSAKMHTPYGATECLPVATIEAAEVLGETAVRTDGGAGICVGRPFDTIAWRIIRITDDPIAYIDDAKELPPGEIGELIVRGPQASPRYVTRTECNDATKIGDAPVDQSEIGAWHRMGDVGYLDSAGRFWYCGRKSQRVETASGVLFTECVESAFNTHPAVTRSALVGVGPSGCQVPVVVCQPTPEVIYCGGRRVSKHNTHRLVHELGELARKNPLTSSIRHFLVRNSLPVDVRHNSKIQREGLARWAAKKLPELA